MLVVLGLGKAAEVLGGSGQGLPTVETGRPATSGPARGAASARTSRRSRPRLYEAIGVAVAGCSSWPWPGPARGVRGGPTAACSRSPSAAGRSSASPWPATWRDPVVVGPLKAEQVIDLAILGLAIVVLAVLAVRAARTPRTDAAIEPAEPGLAWPDPETRRRF